MPQWNFWEDNISFVVFGAAVYRPSFMVDYTERRKTERKKENVSPLHHRPYNTERRSIKRKKNETVFKFLLKYATMNFLRGQHKFCSFWSCGLTFLWGRLHREKKDWEKRKMFSHYITGPTQREEILREIKN